MEERTRSVWRRDGLVSFHYQSTGSPFIYRYHGRQGKVELMVGGGVCNTDSWKGGMRSGMVDGVDHAFQLSVSQWLLF